MRQEKKCNIEPCGLSVEIAAWMGAMRLAGAEVIRRKRSDSCVHDAEDVIITETMCRGRFGHFKRTPAELSTWRFLQAVVGQRCRPGTCSFGLAVDPASQGLVSRTLTTCIKETSRLA